MSLKLGNIAPGATSYTTVCEGGAVELVVRSVLVCNRAGSPGTFRLAHATSTSPSNAEMLFYDVAIAANATTLIEVSMWLTSAQKLVAYASSANMTFAAFGSRV
jgi:hypothetical protein